MKLVTPAKQNLSERGEVIPAIEELSYEIINGNVSYTEVISAAFRLSFV